MEIMGRCVDKNNLASYFPLPCETVNTGGIRDGIVLKFKTFYLKIYDAENGGWSVQGFLYGNDTAVFVHQVNQHQIRSYASQFVNDDYLRMFRMQRC